MKSRYNVDAARTAYSRTPPWKRVAVAAARRQNSLQSIMAKPAYTGFGGGTSGAAFTGRRDR